MSDASNPLLWDIEDFQPYNVEPQASDPFDPAPEIDRERRVMGAERGSGRRDRVDEGAQQGFVGEMPPRDAQLPLEALRDLVGIVRALFAAWTKARVGPLELEELLHIGRELRAALELASKTKPGTVGHRAAWSRAEEATRFLGHLVGQLEALHPVIEAATERALASDTGKRSNSS